MALCAGAADAGQLYTAYATADVAGFGSASVNLPGVSGVLPPVSQQASTAVNVVSIDGCCAANAAARG
jgi:uncharacterized metal-binding protein